MSLKSDQLEILFSVYDKDFMNKQPLIMQIRIKTYVAFSYVHNFCALNFLFEPFPHQEAGSVFCVLSFYH